MAATELGQVVASFQPGVDPRTVFDHLAIFSSPPGAVEQQILADFTNAPAGVSRRRATIPIALLHEQQPVQQTNPTLYNQVVQGREGAYFEDFPPMFDYPDFKHGVRIWIAGQQDPPAPDGATKPYVEVEAIQYAQVDQSGTIVTIATPVEADLPALQVAQQFQPHVRLETAIVPSEHPDAGGRRVRRFNP